ncbi:MAG: hypothetical protein JO264_12915 [Acidisphaera sp.]|nr:hypothetical protein [Acidisphaera sp.]
MSAPASSIRTKAAKSDDTIDSAAWLKPSSAAILVATAPTNLLSYTSALVPAAECRLVQKLFGFEAQLCAFESVLRENGAELFFMPAPELFASSESYRHLTQLSGVDSARVIHFRFGMARHARLLKHAENLSVLAERHVCLPLTPSAHPFAAGNVLPAGISSVLLYEPVRPNAVRLGGGTLRSHTLSPAYVSRDIETALQRKSTQHAGAGRAAEHGAGLYVRSFAEFQPSLWLRNEAGEGPGGGSTDWRRVLALSQLSGIRDDASLGFVLIPWNLSHPASVIPDVVLKLCRTGNLHRAGYRPVLFPYNENGDSAQVIDALVVRARAALHATRGALRSVFLARLRSLDAAWMLPRLFSLAWIEAADPEQSWNVARLAALDIRSALLGQTIRPDADSSSVAFSLPSDEALPISVSDQFGDRAYSAPSVSTRGLAALVTRSLAEIRSGRDVRPLLHSRADDTMARPFAVSGHGRSGGGTMRKGEA